MEHNIVIVYIRIYTMGSVAQASKIRIYNVQKTFSTSKPATQ